MTREEIIKELENYIPWADEYEVDIEVLTGALELLKQEPCGDAISRQAVDDAIYDYSRSCDVNYAQIMEYIDKIPSVNPQEPKTGHWIEHPEIETSTPEYLMFYECSECGGKQCFTKSDIHKKRFCSNCGCRMVEPQESEIHCNHTDAEIAKSFIEDVEAVKDLLPQESDHKCHTCKHYTSGENDGSCGSYICKGYSNWESEE